MGKQEIMAELEDAGWKKAADKKAEEVTEVDIKSIFKLVDMDDSGTVSRTEARMATKLLQKRFGIKNVKDWMKDNDTDGDGRLSYAEFKKSLKQILNIQLAEEKEAGEEVQETE